MRTLIVITFLFCVSLNMKSQSYEIKNGDTLNLTDAKEKKQGKWVYMGVHRPGKCSNLEQVLEKGEYKDNKKTGIWLEFFCNGNLKNQITFVNGRPDGPAIIYRENGTILEKGIWKDMNWVEVTHYHSDGNVEEKIYDETGKLIDTKKSKGPPLKPVVYSDPTKK